MSEPSYMNLRTEDKYLLISATNRKNSRTAVLTQLVSQQMNNMGITHEVYQLDQIDSAWFSEGMYDAAKRAPDVDTLQQQLFIPANKWIIVSPEYNGSFPGILKLFLDLLSIKWMSPTFELKKVLLIGVASGRAGNLRGMDHLTGILNYLKMVVFPTKQPISSVNSVISNPETPDLDQETQKVLTTLLAKFKDF